MAFLPERALFRRDVLRQLRATSTIIFLSLTSGIAILFFLFQLEQMARYPFFPSGMLFGLSSMTLFMTALFVTPAMVAGASICTERQRDTYDLMIMTTLRPTGILLSKYLGSVFVYFAIACGALPLFGVTFFYVGVMPLQLLQALTYTGMTALSCAAVSTAASSFFKRTVAAVLFSYLLAAGVCGLFVLVPGAILVMLGNPFRAFALHIFEHYPTVWSPLAGLASCLDQSLSAEEVVGSIIYQLAIIIFALVIARLLMTRHTVVPKVDDATAAVALPRAQATPRKSVRIRPLGDRTNPLYFKEKLVFVGKNPKRTKLIYLACPIVFLIALYIQSEIKTPYLYVSLSQLRLLFTIVFSATTGFMLLLLPPVLAPILSREHEQENMDLLRTTLMTPAEIIIGKMLGAWRILALILAMILLGFLPLYTWILYGDAPAIQFLVALQLGQMATTLFVASALCVAVGVRAQTDLGAMVRAFAALFIFLLLIPGLFMSVMEPFWRGSAGRTLMSTLIPYLSPLFNQFAVGESAPDQHNLAAVVCHYLLGLLFLSRAISYMRHRGMRDK